MTIHVLNTSNTQKNVPIILADGTSDDIHVQPRGRVKLSPGQKVDPSYRAQANGVTVIDDAPAAQEKLAAAKAAPTAKVVSPTKN